MRVRPASPDDAEAVARVHVDTWRTTYAGLVPESRFPTYEQRLERWRTILADPPHTHTFVADAGGQIIGFANGGPERSGDPRFLGEIYALYVLEPQQRRGVGTALVRAVAQALEDDGIRTMLVWVLRENPACGFYEALGGVVVRTRAESVGTRQLSEVAYGWDDTAAAGLAVRSGPAEEPAPANRP